MSNNKCCFYECSTAIYFYVYFKKVSVKSQNFVTCGFTLTDRSVCSVLYFTETKVKANTLLSVL